MTVLRVILFFYSIFVIFIAGGLFFRKKDSIHLLLSLYTLFFGIEMIDYLYSTSQLVYIFPQYFGLYYFLVGFVYGPLLWFHFRSLIFPERIFSFKQLLHFLPLIVIIALNNDILILPGMARINFVKEHFLDRIMPLNYIRAAHLLVYGITFVTLIYKNRQRLTPDNRIYAISTCIIYFLTAVLVSWLTLYADNWRQFIIYYFSSSTIVLIIGIILYINPDFLESIAKKYLHSGIDCESMNRIADKIRTLFGSTDIYLKREFSMDKLANEIGEKPYSISQTFSGLIGENFNDFLNRHRIDYAKKLLGDSNFDHYKIEAIALESGFNNKVTFNKAFTKFALMTPSVYRNNRV